MKNFPCYSNMNPRFPRKVEQFGHLWITSWQSCTQQGMQEQGQQPKHTSPTPKTHAPAPGSYETLVIIPLAHLEQ